SGRRRSTTNRPPAPTRPPGPGRPRSPPSGAKPPSPVASGSFSASRLVGLWYAAQPGSRADSPLRGLRLTAYPFCGLPLGRAEVAGAVPLRPLRGRTGYPHRAAVEVGGVRAERRPVDEVGIVLVLLPDQRNRHLRVQLLP